MSTNSRERLNKLKVDVLKSIAEESGIVIKKQKKDELINDIITHQAPLSALTPVSLQVSPHDALFPTVDSKENLPPFHTVPYKSFAALDIPTLSFSGIYQYMINRQLTSGGNVGNFKGMDKAVKHFDAGDVQDVTYSKIDGSTYYVKAFCLASMKKQRYQVYVCITTDTNSPSISYGYCQCPIGMAQACSHIGALLFALSKANKTEQLDTQPVVASTSKLCQWNVPRQNVKTQPISQLSNKKPRISTTTEEKPAFDLEGFDPRHTIHRTSDTDNKLYHLQLLKGIFSNTGMSHLWNIPDHAPIPSTEVEINTTEDPLVLGMKSLIITKGNVPPLSIDQTLVDFIEQHTREQRNSSIWRDLHIGRITSSLFGRVLRSGENPSSLVRQIVEGSSMNKYDKLPMAVQWGIDCEEKALADYIMLQTACSEHFHVEATGLTLCNSHSFLGASSDGRVTDGENHGVLEIKCPFSLQGLNINKMEVSDIIALNNKNFCLESFEGTVQLKRNHPYYAQVQGEMAIMGLPWCDFVVWTDAPMNNIFIDRVLFDPEFVKNMLPKLVTFYVKHVLPELEA